MGLTELQLEELFAPVKDKKGLQGSRLENFLLDFRAGVERLNAHPKIHITHLHLEDPGDFWDLDLQTVSRYHGLALDPEIRSLYAQVNGLQMRWVHADHPRFDKTFDLQFHPGRFDDGLIEEEMGRARYVNFCQADEFLQPEREINFLSEGSVTFHYLNYDQHFSGQLAARMDTEAKTLELYVGDDYFAEHWKLKTDFPTYMLKKIAFNDEAINSAGLE